MLSKKLFNLIESVRLEGNLETAFFLANDMIEQGEDLPLDLETNLIALISDCNEVSFVELSKNVLSKNMLNDYVKNIKLISFLVEKSWLSLEDAALLLSSIPHVERGKLPQHFSKVVEVADLVCEDSRDGFMEVNDDDLLINTLKTVNELPRLD